MKKEQALPMAEANSAVKKAPPQRGPMGGRPGGGVAEKPKNFGRTLRKLIKYMRSSLPIIILSFILAIAAVILNLNVPNITGNATDRMISGVTSMQFYNGINKGLAENSEALGGGKLSDFYDEKNGVTTIAELAKTDTAIGKMLSDSLATLTDEAARGSIESINLRVAPSVDIAGIINMVAIALALIIVAAVLSYLQGFLLSGVAQKISYHFRRDIESKFNKLPLKYYDKTSNGEVLSYLTNDVDTISSTLDQSMSQIVSGVTMIVGVLIMMLRISWILTLLAVVIVPISLILISIVVKFSQKHFINQQRYLGTVNGQIEEMYAGHTVVSLYNGEDESVAEFTVNNDKLARSTRAAQFLSGLMMPIMQFVGNIGYVMTCVVGGVLVIKNINGMTVGKIQAFIQYIRQFNQPLSQMANVVNTLQSAVAAAERVFGFIEAEEEMETGDKVPQNTEGNVEFRNVRFGYNEDKIIIKDFSSKIKAGDSVAIVGPTGAGKTTMVKLLMRYYDLNGGEILLDGAPISEFSRLGLRGELGMVLQDTWLFNGSIMENIRYGNLSATDDEVIAAAKVACADHFIRTLPGGYAFEINEEAGNISQGQKQLLTIARAVLNDPKVLILDEATSSVDTRTEVLIQKAMDRLMRGRTSFVIAHRLSTIKDADKILVMKDGDIIEQGTHDELMEQKGFYETLYNSQFQ